MNTEITLLADDALDAVAGGFANNGAGQHFEVPQNRVTGGKNDPNSGLLGDFLASVGVVLLVGAIAA